MSGMAAARTVQGWAAHGKARTDMRRVYPVMAKIVAAELAWHLSTENRAIADPGVVSALTAEISALVGDLKRGAA